MPQAHDCRRTWFRRAKTPRRPCRDSRHCDSRRARPPTARWPRARRHSDLAVAPRDWWRGSRSRTAVRRRRMAGRARRRVCRDVFVGAQRIHAREPGEIRAAVHRCARHQAQILAERAAVAIEALEVVVRRDSRPSSRRCPSRHRRNTRCATCRSAVRLTSVEGLGAAVVEPHRDRRARVCASWPGLSDSVVRELSSANAS